ncbi:hypothetical protein [Zhihengliuella salsuginis]|uniref:Uncharacterized protein n=1 Tax=Zhihengliuella salsuginis TaxID=578222 RepID=A0ABQ3GKX7_9MICC|nr:hypothetical protein [Zhihengliuella salsuginis]GHD10305.1 hypothetical protein GCM10008096_23730 [Zhihengliuella salsuginis]
MSLIFADRADASTFDCDSSEDGHHLGSDGIVSVIEAAINHRHSTVRATITGLHRASGRIDVLLATGGAFSAYHHELAAVAAHLPIGRACRWVPGASALIGPRVGSGRERTRRVLSVSRQPPAPCPQPAAAPRTVPQAADAAPAH